MGGLGSGGWNDTGRPLDGNAMDLDVNKVRRAGCFADGYQSGWRWRWSHGRECSISLHGRGERQGVTLAYTVSSNTSAEPFSVREHVGVDWTPCRFGGDRPWWLCPGCGDRVMKLYGVGARYRCRKCHRLAYRTQREKAHDRIQTRANKLRKRLGGEPGVDRIPPKPKGMHWRTYERHCRELYAADDAFYDYVRRRWPECGL